MKRRLSLIWLMVLSLLLPYQAFAAETIPYDDYYYARAPVGAKGSYSFTGKASFPTAVQELVINRSNTKITVTCNGVSNKGSLITLNGGSSSLSCTMTVPDDVTGAGTPFASIVRARDLNEGKTYVLERTPPESTTPPSGGTSGGDGITYKAYYVDHLDQYRMDYKAPSNTASYKLIFKNADGTEYVKEFTGSPSGIHYLTCNGTYEMEFFDSSGKSLGKTQPPYKTSGIKSPTCSSYPDGEGTGFNDLNAKYNGSAITWDDVNADRYLVYKDGMLVGETTTPNYETTEDGSYSIVAEKNGDHVGQSDLNVSSGGNNGGGDLCGDMCGKLDELLACPGWNEVMGDVSQAIRDALDWDDIADKIGSATIQHLDNYLGDVPAPPSKEEISNEITPQLPNLDTTVETPAPSMPSEFDKGAMDFDIENGEVIEIKDESKPFIITDPLANIKHDGVGVPVFPNDPRNESGGIKNPDKVDTGGAAIPQHKPSEPVPEKPEPSIPPSEIPIPEGSESTIPIPNVPTSEMPKPNQKAIPSRKDIPIPNIPR